MNSVDSAELRVTLASELGSEFELGDVVGSGGFAVVFRARDHVLHRDVAVKVLSSAVDLDEKAEDRFGREARMIASLEHPNIVPVFRAGIAGRVPYILMRFVVGRSLQQVLEERQALDWAEATRIALQAADALAYAHAHGVIHLDIKPANLLLDQSHNLLVADFGIARILSEQGASATEGSAAPMSGSAVQTTVTGTLRYMSPEQGLGEPLDARADVYALGIVLHEMLTGRVPFDGATPAATLRQQLARDLSALNAPSVPSGLHPILRRALAASPSDRFADAGELRDAIAAFRAGMSVRSVRRRISLTAAALGLVATLATSGTLLWQWASRSALARRSPAIDAVGATQIPDSLMLRLRAMGAADSAEVVRYVFAPAGATIRDAFVLTDRRMIRLTEGVPRAHALTDILGVSMARRSGRNTVILSLRAKPGAISTADTLYTGLGDKERASLNEKLVVFQFTK